MLSLVIKDILVQKKSLSSVLLVSAIIFLIFQGFTSSGGYIFGTMYFIYILLAGVFGYDEKNKSDILINSLPTNRKSVVLSRYLSLLVFTILSILFITLLGAAVTLTGIPLNVNIITINDIFVIFVFSILIFSIYVPIYFKFGYLKSRIANMVLYITMFASSGVIMGIRQALAQEKNGVLGDIMRGTPEWLLYLMPVIILAAVVALSINVSIKVYRGREF